MASELGRCGTTLVVVGTTGVTLWVRESRAEGCLGVALLPDRPTIAAARETAAASTTAIMSQRWR
jgi:hypothetical protein